MTKQQIVDTVNDIMAKNTDIETSEIKPEDSYVELCIDSIRCLEVLLEIEEELCVNIPSKKLSHTTTMQQVYDIVEQAIVDTHGFEVH